MRRGEISTGASAGDRVLASLAGRVALLCSRAFLLHCLRLYILEPEVTTATDLDHKYLVLFPLGQDALGGRQMIAVIMFLPCDVEDLDMETPRGISILGLVAAGLKSMGLPFEGVNVHDLMPVLYAVLTAPAFSMVNCEAAGVLSGVADITSCLHRYATADFDVVRLDEGKWRVTICGVDVGDDTLYREDYPSDLAVDAARAGDLVKSFLIFGHAGGASPEAREAFQTAALVACVDSLRPDKRQELFYVRACPEAPEVRVAPTFDETMEGFFNAPPPWHPKHPDFARQGDFLMSQTKSEIKGPRRRARGAAAGSKRWGAATHGRQPGADGIVGGLGLERREDEVEQVARHRQRLLEHLLHGVLRELLRVAHGSKPFSARGSVRRPGGALASSASAISSLPLVTPWMTSRAPDPSSWKSSRACESQLSLDTMDDERASHPKSREVLLQASSSGAGASEAAHACGDLRPAELRAR
ncbi:hypothetical protein SO694_00130033 [Aureococcus anophagefferens]|uniref:Uncharacterized protein n=1 Tax=Aureococcus anophagefferens TaxID=44056 RepID=A0ABR1GFL5_AURAN